MSLVMLPDGYRINVEEVGAGLPVMLLHGGPGLDHTMFRPWLDPLADEFRLLYVDERGQGSSERVDPQTVTLSVWAGDIDLLAVTLELDRFAVLGHSFGAFIALTHAIERGTADGYVISGGADTRAALDADVTAAIEALGDDGAAIAKSWEDEKTVQTDEEFAALLEAQMPFHFAGAVPADFAAATVYAPEVLRHAANTGYHDFDFPPQLDRIRKPTLIVVGERDRTTTPRAARVLHDGIADSELSVIPEVGHMSFVEAPDVYIEVVRSFFRRVAA